MDYDEDNVSTREENVSKQFENSYNKRLVILRSTIRIRKFKLNWCSLKNTSRIKYALLEYRSAYSTVFCKFRHDILFTIVTGSFKFNQHILTSGTTIELQSYRSSNIGIIEFRFKISNELVHLSSQSSQSSI
ncbi:hypothetical protein BLOT_005188 [Blomia tropicalis]|nr:hypothetical protein BLOT_005188 [Blomia tropicalis]